MNNILFSTMTILSFLVSMVALVALYRISVMLLPYFRPSIQRRSKIFGMALLLTVGVGAIILPTASATTGMSGETITSTPTPIATSEMDPNMPGMDHSPTSTSTSTSTPTPIATSEMDPNMPGMDHSPTSTPTPIATSEMDPNMPGMDHSDSHSTPESHGEPATSESQQRPLKAALSIFGFGTLSVLLSAMVLRRKDRKLAVVKQMARAEKMGAKNE